MRNSDRQRARLATARLEHQLNYGTKARRPARKRALWEGFAPTLAGPLGGYNAPRRRALAAERPAAGMGRKAPELRFPLTLASLDVDPFESPESRAVLQLLCQFLQTNNVSAVFDWLMNAPDYERGLALRLVRRALIDPASGAGEQSSDLASDVNAFNQIAEHSEQVNERPASQLSNARTAAARRTPRAYRSHQHMPPERFRAPTPRPASSLSMSSVSLDQYTQVFEYKVQILVLSCSISITDTRYM